MTVVCERLAVLTVMGVPDYFTGSTTYNLSYSVFINAPICHQLQSSVTATLFKFTSEMLGHRQSRVGLRNVKG